MVLGEAEEARGMVGGETWEVGGGTTAEVALISAVAGGGAARAKEEEEKEEKGTRLTTREAGRARRAAIGRDQLGAG